jgi:medium-chain acyl-[acyl-carrier-protein] hydrolase
MINNNEKKSWFISHSKNSYAKVNLFCFHHAGGSAAFFRDWPNLLTPFVNLFAAQLPGRDTRHDEPFAATIDIILRELLAYKQLFIDKPLILFGHSLGSIIAFELARQLENQSITSPKCLIVSGRCSPQLSDAQEKVYSLPDALFIKRLIEKYGGINEEIQKDKNLLNLFLPRLRADINLSENYKYVALSPLECPIFVMSGAGDPSVNRDDLLGWQAESKAPGKIYMFDGEHFFLESNKTKVIDRLNRLLMSFI